VALDGLRPGTVPGFRIYLQVEDRWVPVHGRTEPFTAEARERLLAFKVPTVFVSRDDVPRYLAYLEGHLEEIVKDPAVSEGVKAGLVYRSTQGLVQGIIAHPNEPTTVERSRQAAQVTVDYILRGREAFLGLLSNCSFDYQTYTHSVNVCIFGVALARRIGMATGGLAELGTALLLHDIGKSLVDPAILHKTGGLTDEEWTVMKRHPRWGVDLSLDKSGMSPAIADVILHHHEKLDGSGYPDGIGGGDITTMVRITSICDIFDALSTNRCYKRALPTYDTIALMQKDLRDKLDLDLLREMVILLKAGDTAP
jgi:HD-GYP domain-containing protein (c-di-GMP phosphodiesterase class II)